jgi:hypothetical protein
VGPRLAAIPRMNRATDQTDASPSAPAGGSDGYGQALGRWKQGATVPSAQQGAYWMRAASDLQAGRDSDSGDTCGYPEAIDQLTNLASLPDAQQTPSQNQQYHTDIDALDEFFGTPGLYN